MVGALNKLPVAASGMLFFGDPVTLGSVAAVAVGFFAGVVYAVAKNNQKRAERERDAGVLPMTNTRISSLDFGLSPSHLYAALPTHASPLVFSRGICTPLLLVCWIVVVRFVSKCRLLFTLLAAMHCCILPYST